MITIAVANQKGGVGKTTTAVHLAYWFAQKGQRVLLVDLDMQGHACFSLGVEKSNSAIKLFNRFSSLEVSDAAIPARSDLPNLHIVQSNKDTAELSKVYNAVSDPLVKYYFIEEKLAETEGMYDLTFIDMGPGSDLLQIAGLVASDYFIVPARMDPMSINSVTEIIRTATTLESLQPEIVSPQLLGVLPTEYDQVTNETVQMIKELASLIGSQFILPPILRDTAVREASEIGVTVWEYAPSTNAAIGYSRGKIEYPNRNSQGRVGGYLHIAEIIASVLDIDIPA
jgi:chromosome partitioning protein